MLFQGRPAGADAGAEEEREREARHARQEEERQAPRGGRDVPDSRTAERLAGRLPTLKARDGRERF